ncbi:MAG: type II secretion system protein [Longicatena sp.]
MKKNKGFTLVEVLVALLCVSLASILLVHCVRLLQHLSQPTYWSEDRIAIHQIRLMLAQGENYFIEGDNLTFQYHGKERTLGYHRNRLVARDGYEIFLQEINESTFIKEGACYYVSYTRKTTKTEALLVCE